jgi:hypothetical protein
MAVAETPPPASSAGFTASAYYAAAETAADATSAAVTTAAATTAAATAAAAAAAAATAAATTAPGTVAAAATADTVPAPGADGTFAHSFASRPLGLGLAPATVATDPGTVVKSSKIAGIHIGDVVLEVDHEAVGHLTLERLFIQLASLPLPIHIKFARPALDYDTVTHTFAGFPLGVELKASFGVEVAVASVRVAKVSGAGVKGKLHEVSFSSVSGGGRACSAAGGRCGLTAAWWWLVVTSMPGAMHLPVFLPTGFVPCLVRF